MTVAEGTTGTAPVEHRRRAVVRGVVQGVGFRPHVHRLASGLGLTGFVGNDGRGVVIEVQGGPAGVDEFLGRLVSEAPALAVVDGVEVSSIGVVAGGGAGGGAGGDGLPGAFAIIRSRTMEGATTLIPPDVATCDLCLAEVLDPTDRRFRYPFTNCTACGPRFTIIRALPYDRPSTSMSGFPLCDTCAAEYADPTDRRFHAEPIACPACGPRLTFLMDGRALEGTDAVLAAVQGVLAEGGTVAVKGIGGYHLACDATGDDPVARLRERKGRGAKPFALMVPDLATARRIAEVDPGEEEALRSPARPIVLCRRRTDAPVSDLVAPGNPLVGLMLPYTPLHHLLFLAVPGSDVPPPAVIVLTSGNVTDERICFEDDAPTRLAGLADAVCTHDRPIELPCDDSVVRVTDGCVVPVRRSRGFAPLPVRLPVPVVPTVAFGGELKAAICVASGDHAWMSQHIGDLGNLETERALEDIRASFCRIYGVDPEVHAVDRHPGYRTHRLSLEGNWPGRVEVQHHHAHIASVMVEHGLDGSSPVIGVAFDGTGYGTSPDGTPEIWGSEILLADYAGFERMGHLAPLPLPGGDAAVRNPCRIALAYLAALDVATGGTSPAELACGATERTVVSRMVERGTGCAPTTSMGRMFDAAASILGICHRATYEAQAAIELEAAASSARPVRPIGFGFADTGILDPRPVLEGLVAGVADGVDSADLACSFHHAVAGAVVASAHRVAAASGRLPVALSGGVFQNALLTGLVRRSLEADGFTVLTHRSVPPNDGGLALGQAAVAGYRRS